MFTNEQYREELLFEVHKMGRVDEFWQTVEKVKKENPHLSTTQSFEQAYNIIIN